MFKVGQKVICKVYGEGVVISVDDEPGEVYPVDVEFAVGGRNCYTEDGKLWVLDDEPSLTVIEE